LREKGRIFRIQQERGRREGGSSLAHAFAEEEGRKLEEAAEEGSPAAIQEELEERERDGGSWEVQGEETSGGLSFRNLYRDFPFSTSRSTKFADLLFFG
jgi:hypothetical protein